MVLSPLGVTFSREKVCVVGILFRFRLGIPPKLYTLSSGPTGNIRQVMTIVLGMRVYSRWKVCFCASLVSCMWRMDWIGIQIAWSTLPKSVECVQHHYLPPYTLLKNTHLEKDNTSETIYPFLVFAHFFFAHNTHIWVYTHTRSKVVWHPVAIFFH